MHKKRIFCFLLMSSLSACTFITKPTIEQGNIIKPAMVKQLRTGMSQTEVQGIMGNPVLINVFTPNRVEYIYTYQSGNKPSIVRQVSCLFENGILKNFTYRI